MFKLDLTDKGNLKNPKKTQLQLIWVIITQKKNIKSE